MSIIDTIVSALRSLTGGGTEESTATGGSGGQQPSGQVSVEHEPDAETEAAVKGGGVEPEDTDAAAAGTDAAASTGTLVDEEAGKEPAETVGEAGGVDVDRTADEDGVGGGDTEDGDGGSESEVESGAGDGDTDPGDSDGEAHGEAVADEAESADDADEEDAPEGSAESVETIKGIGPAYAGRLEEFGIDTVGELAAADAAAVAEGIDVSESRVSDWIDRATDTS